MRRIVEQYPSTEIMDRINAVFRPMEAIIDRRGVYVRLLEILDGLPTRDERVTAFGYAAFDAYPFAYFSGPETPASEYPDTNDPRMQALGEIRERRIDAEAQKHIARCRATPMALSEVADRLWAFIEQLQTVPERVLACAIMVQVVGVRAVRVFKEDLPPLQADHGDAAYRDALWKHRQTIRECRWCLFHAGDSGALRSKTEAGDLLLMLLHEIDDAWERACVLWFLVEQIAKYGRDEGAKMILSAPRNRTIPKEQLS